jgi:hypothetical protein
MREGDERARSDLARAGGVNCSPSMLTAGKTGPSEGAVASPPQLGLSGQCDL